MRNRLHHVRRVLSGISLMAMLGGLGCTPAPTDESPPAAATAARGPVERERGSLPKSPAAEPKRSQRKKPAPADWMGEGAFSGEDLFSPGTARWVPPEIDDARMLAAGIVKIAGQHLVLYTDVRDTASVEELPAVFDRAVPQWCDYFGIPPQRAATWRMTGYLILDKERFRRSGLLPDDLPPFLNGYQRKAELWLYEQSTDYYRRHLLLHEGTHGFMNWALGGAGPPWYMEGTAELLATHRWQEGRLALRHFPVSKDDTPHWGRIKILKSDLAAGRGKTLEQVMLYDATAHLEVEPYAWCWAAAIFFETDPATQAAFRDLRRRAQDASERFSQRFYEQLKSEWPRLARQWQVFIHQAEYGYSLERERLDPRPARPIPNEGATIRVAADRGWQSSGYLLDAGARYRFTANGRYQVADQPKIWWCEPNGVTIRYNRGLPLGILLGAIVDEATAPDGPSTLVNPTAIGSGLDSQADRSGTLFLRINDSGAQLADNAGDVTVTVQKLADTAP